MTTPAFDPSLTDPVLRDDRLLDALARGDSPVCVDDPVADLLTCWRAELLARAEAYPPRHTPPHGEALPVPAARPAARPGGPTPPARRAAADPARRPDRRPRRRRPLLTAVTRAALALATTAGGICVSAAQAEPGSPLWSVTQVVYADRARSRLAVHEARQAVEEARRALGEGRYADARSRLDRALVLLAAAGQNRDAARLRATAEVLRRRLPDTVTSPTAPDLGGTSALGPATRGKPVVPPGRAKKEPVTDRPHPKATPKPGRNAAPAPRPTQPRRADVTQLAARAPGEQAHRPLKQTYRLGKQAHRPGKQTQRPRTAAAGTGKVTRFRGPAHCPR